MKTIKNNTVTGISFSSFSGHWSDFRIVLSILWLCGACFTSYAQTGTWRWVPSYADVTFPSGVATPHNSRFCVITPYTTVSVGFEGGATTALLQKEGAAWNAYLGAGNHTLSQGCYVHSVGSYMASGSIPKSHVVYNERYIATGITIGGVGRKAHSEVGSSLLDKGTTSLGNLSGRLLIDIYGLDDRFYIKINNEPEVRVASYNQRKIYEFSQRLKIGNNTIKIRFSDRNNGKCFHVAYRIGDKNSWKFGDNFANTDCPSPLPVDWKTVYKKTFTFNYSL